MASPYLNELFWPEEWTTIFLSLRVALLATLMCLPVGIGLAWVLARRDFWGKSALNSIIHLPLVLPPVVTGYLLLIAFGKKGIVGAFLSKLLAWFLPFAGPAPPWRGPHGASAHGPRHPAFDRKH